MEVIQDINPLRHCTDTPSQNWLRPSTLQPLNPIRTPEAFYTVRVAVRAEGLSLSSSVQLDEETREVNEWG
jgi:hypothetical protein